MSYELIETVEVGSGGAASIEFTSIPADYTDLLLLTSTRQSGTGVNIGFIQFNDSTSNFTIRFLEGSGSAASSGSSSLNYASLDQGSSSTANTFTNNSIYISNYAGSTAKSYSVDTVTENNATAAFQHIQAGLWNDTSAITSVKILSDSGTYVEFTSASLYGII